GSEGGPATDATPKRVQWPPRVGALPVDTELRGAGVLRPKCWIAEERIIEFVEGARSERRADRSGEPPPAREPVRPCCASGRLTSELLVVIVSGADAESFRGEPSLILEEAADVAT